MSVKNVVAEHKRATAGADKLLADQKCLGNAFGLRLRRVLEMDAVAGAIAEQVLESGQIVGRGDEQNVANAGQHQRGERVVHHRLVVHRQQALGGAVGDGIEARARSARENDAFVIRWRGFGHVKFQSRLSFLRLGGVVFRHPLTITAAGHIADPVFVFKIPANGLANSTLKRL